MDIKQGPPKKGRGNTPHALWENATRYLQYKAIIRYGLQPRREPQQEVVPWSAANGLEYYRKYLKSAISLIIDLEKLYSLFNSRKSWLGFLLFFFRFSHFPTKNGKHPIIVCLIWVSCGLRCVKSPFAKNLRVWGKPTTRCQDVANQEVSWVRKKESHVYKNKHCFFSAVLYFSLKTVPGPPSFPFLLCPLPCCVLGLPGVVTFLLLHFCWITSDRVIFLAWRMSF